MGTLQSNPTAVAAFDAQIFKKGLDLKRSIFSRSLGTEVAGPAADFRPGQIVTRDASGYIQPCTGLYSYGVAKWGKTQLGNSLTVDKEMVLTGTTAISLGRGSVSNVTVRAAPDMGGALYVGAGTDYTVVALAGTVARAGGSAITDGQTVYVTFTYALTADDFLTDGTHWFGNEADRATFNAGRVAVITDWSRLFTVEWATGKGVTEGLTYALTGAPSNLYCNADGRFSNDPVGDLVGRCYQLPTNDDPFMGVTYHGNPVV